MLRRLLAWLRRLRGTGITTLVVGAPGSGKRTLAQRWQSNGTQVEHAVPARVPPRANVVFVVDARALCGCLGWTPGRSLADVRQQAARLGSRLREGHRGGLAVVVTHTDVDCRVGVMKLVLFTGQVPLRDYADLTSAELAPLLNQLARGRQVPVLAGSLADPAGADHLARSVSVALGLAPVA